MRWSLLLCGVAVLGACSSSEKTAKTDTAAPAPAAVAPANLSLADVAGKWNMTATNPAGDTTVIKYVMTATADTTGWMIQFSDRKTPVAVHVMPSADSVIVMAGPYPSALRKNVQVSTNGSFHMMGGSLMGTTVAHYNVKTADSVRTLKVTGTKAP